ncbi:MAG: response regulator transcription factor [Burkholderiales bacterium]
MRLLLVEDDAMIGESLEEGLRAENYAVDWVRDGAAATLAIANGVYDLVLLDLGLPRKEGLEVLADYRKSGGGAPVIVITARDATSDRVRGLDAGADDYLVKPFEFEELFARMRALLRRGAGRADPELRFAGLTLNPATREASIEGRTLGLTAREFALLQALMRRPGEVVSRAALEEQLYGWNEEIASNTVEVHIHALRRKIGAGLIRNVRGVGYKMAHKP